MSGGGLRARLIGGWTLLSYREAPVEGGPDHAPLGEDARGIILYTPDGFVSAQLMRAGRSPFASGDWFDATDGEVREASSYIAYTGRYVLDEAAGTLTHGMDISFFPNWLGQVQPRAMHLEDDRLTLATIYPIRSGGRMVMSRLHWQRAL